MSMKKEYSNLAVCSYVLREGKSIKRQRRSRNIDLAKDIDAEGDIFDDLCRSCQLKGISCLVSPRSTLPVVRHLRPHSARVTDVRPRLVSSCHLVRESQGLSSTIMFLVLTLYQETHRQQTHPHCGLALQTEDEIPRPPSPTATGRKKPFSTLNAEAVNQARQLAITGTSRCERMLARLLTASGLL
jgi:hypothetical protein